MNGAGSVGVERGASQPLRDAWLIAVGDELLLGRTADTDSQEVARALSAHGVSVRGVVVVPDDAAAVAAALDAAPAGALICLSGGLGPTADDLTREAIAGWAGVGLREDPELVAQLRARCRERGFPYGEGTARQTLVPAGMSWAPNPVGSAPGLYGTLRQRMLLALPGVPAELRALLPELLARLAAAGRLPPPQPARLLRTAQLAESQLAALCAPLQAEHPDLRWSWWLVTYGVDVRISLAPGGDPAALAAAGDALRARLGGHVYAEDDRTLAEIVQGEMLRRGWKLAVAESCTGGLIGARLTDVAGSSGYLRGGVTAYADEVKRAQLGVPAALLAAHGAVSRPVAEAMARGCREGFGVEIALAVTGIAGPEGGSPVKPVGTTWIAAATGEGTHARCYRFPGTRRRNRQLAAAVAIDTVRRLLAGGGAAPPWLPDDAWAAGNAEAS